VTRILAALLERARTGSGPRIVVSMTHRSHDLVSHRLGGEPVPRLLTGGLACYRLYETADGYVTVGALEPKFFARLAELLGRPDLADRQYDENQEGLVAELAAIFTTRSRDAWLKHFGDEDVCVGPVFTREEAAAALGMSGIAHDEVPLGAHTDAWRRELGVS
jgi:crotonobetainyl-CoA:carnitine CoA-transferase CaiB-like acyl-CoA transferase